MDYKILLQELLDALNLSKKSLPRLSERLKAMCLIGFISLMPDLLLIP